MSSKPKLLTIGDIEASKSSSIWVLNKSNPKGNITITVPNGMGNVVTVMVPVTWIPVDMTTQATKQSLLASPVFRRMMTLGMIAIISEEDAQKLLSEDDARVEMQRIYAMPQELSGNPETIPAAVTSIKSEVAGEVSGFALNISHTDSLDEAQVMNAIKGNDGTMTETDMKYIVANSKYGKVKTYLTERLLAK
jgi:hypothetical protein